jgi:hypothetical protein
MRPIEIVLPLLRQHLSTPEGLLLLSGLIPLIVFYLVKPEPEQKVMPSLMFFRSQESDSKLRSAFRRLFQNLVLFLQILAVIGIAVAAAQPFTQTEERSEKAVVVLDVSASMQGRMAEAAEYLDGRLASSNTLIKTGESSEVVLRDADPETVLAAVRGTETYDTGSNFAAGIRLSGNFQGRKIAISDFDQTEGETDLQKLIQATRISELKNFETTNRWGVTDAEIDPEEIRLTVRSFLSSNTTVDASFNGEERKIELRPGFNSVTLEPETGRNVFRLPEDDMEADNAFRAVIPETENPSVRFYGSGNRFLEKAVELMETAETADPDEDAEVFIMGEDSVLSDPESVASSVKDGGLAVLFPESNVEDTFNLSEGPVRNTSVTLEKPVKIELSDTAFINRSISAGISLSNPEAAVIKRSLGEGNVVVFNFRSEEFARNVRYPVFWKKLFQNSTRDIHLQDLNVEAGSRVDPSRFPEIDSDTVLETGFYSRSDGRDTAVNLLSPDESSTDGENVNSVSRDVDTDLSRQSISHLVVVLVALVMISELGYLRYRGELE